MEEETSEKSPQEAPRDSDSPQTSPEEPESPGMSPEDREVLDQFQRQLESMTVSDHLVYMMQSLSALAVRNLGLAGEAGDSAHLEQARLAIDAFSALLDVSAHARSTEEMGFHRGTLSQLRMAYVGAVNRSTGGAAPPEGTGLEE